MAKSIKSMRLVLHIGDTYKELKLEGWSEHQNTEGILEIPIRN